MAELWGGLMEALTAAVDEEKGGEENLDQDENDDEEEEERGADEEKHPDAPVSPRSPGSAGGPDTTTFFHEQGGFLDFTDDFKWTVRELFDGNFGDFSEAYLTGYLKNVKTVSEFISINLLNGIKKDGNVTTPENFFSYLSMNVAHVFACVIHETKRHVSDGSGSEKVSISLMFNFLGNIEAHVGRLNNSAFEQLSTYLTEVCPNAFIDGERKFNYTVITNYQ